MRVMRKLHRTGEKSRLFEDVYYAAGSWNKPRRMIMKGEWLEKGANPRFVVTNLEADTRQVYDNFYVQRGAISEHRIKELKLEIQADRLSCQSISSIFVSSCLCVNVGNSASSPRHKTGKGSGFSVKRNGDKNGC